MLKNLMSVFTGWIWTLDPNKNPHKESTPRSQRRADFPAYLWDAKAFPFIAAPFWGIAEVHGIHGHCAVVEHVVRAQPALECDMAGGELFGLPGLYYRKLK